MAGEGSLSELKALTLKTPQPLGCGVYFWPPTNGGNSHGIQCCFLGLEREGRIPDAKTVWRFRERLGCEVFGRQSAHGSDRNRRPGVKNASKAGSPSAKAKAPTPSVSTWKTMADCGEILRQEFYRDLGTDSGFASR